MAAEPTPDRPGQQRDALSVASLAAATLPAVPSASVDPYLDAAARCFARHGIHRTTVPDIAREAATSRTTIYRHLGSIAGALELLVARDLHRLLDGLVVAGEEPTTPRGAVSLMGVVLARCREHPVLSKVLRDEPELVVPFVTSQFGQIVERVSAVVEPMFRVGISHGSLRSTDSRLLAELITRVMASLLLAPPALPLPTFLELAILPLLEA